jgi:hypothetical protein
MAREGKFVPRASLGKLIDHAVLWPAMVYQEEEERRQLRRQRRSGRVNSLSPSLQGTVEPADICLSDAKVSCDAPLVADFLGWLTAEGMVLGFSAATGELVDRMAENDVEVDADEWARARDSGLEIPEQPPFHTVADLAEAAEAEVEWLRGTRASVSAHHIWGRHATRHSGEYEAWTQRSLGPKVMSLYKFHTAMALLEEAGHERGEL